MRGVCRADTGIDLKNLLINNHRNVGHNFVVFLLMKRVILQ